MYHYALLLLLSASLLASSKPLNSLSTRNVCDGVDARPILYHEYRNDACEPRNKFKPDGKTCSGMSHWNECMSYCEVRTNFFYGREHPFPNAYCRGPLSCSISKSKSTSISLGGSISPKAGKTLKFGISGSFSWSTSEAHSRSYSLDLLPGQCGYFTFVPVVKETCGTLSSCISAEGRCLDVPDTTTNIENYCVKQVWHYPPGEDVDGETVFVWTDCENRMPLPMKEQDPIYAKDGVALDRRIYEAYAAAWGNDEIMTTASNIECEEVADDTPKMDDCRSAIGNLTRQATEVPGYKFDPCDDTFWAATASSCTVVINFDKWEDGCKATYVDAAIAALDITDKCLAKDSDKVGGKRPFKTGDCASTIELKNTSNKHTSLKRADRL